MKHRSIHVLAVATLAWGAVAIGPAQAFNPTPEPPSVVPLDSAHWVAGAGLPDSTGQSELGLVQVAPTAPDSHTLVASIQHLPSSVTELGVAAQTPSGIDPCWKVGVIGADGSTFTLHLTTDSAQMVVVSSGGGDVAPFIQWTWSLNLPSGDRVTSAAAEAMSDPSTSSGGQVSFDGFSVNGQTISNP